LIFTSREKVDTDSRNSQKARKKREINLRAILWPFILCETSKGVTARWADTKRDIHAREK
jgi:hypothetical protein